MILNNKKIVIKSPAKINLFLDVVERGKSGFHKISTVFQAISLFDKLTIKVSNNNKININNRSLQNRPNIVEKVLEIYKKEYNVKEKFNIKIKKNIPVGAGLAGGSSDAAAVITGINRLLNLSLSYEELVNIGKQIGKDIPFFFNGATQIGSNYGEVLRPLHTGMEYFILLIYPGFEISTKESYKNLNPEDFNKEGSVLDNLISGMKRCDIKSTSMSLYNIFENNAFEKYSVIREIRNDICNTGALNVLMSGTGSTVFGIFQNKKNIKKANKKLKQKYKNIILAKPFYNGLLNN